MAVTSSRRSFLLALVFAVTLPVSIQAFQSQDDTGAKAYQLTVAERDTAVKLAERALNERNLRTKGRLYLVDEDLVRGKPEKGEGEPSRLARITHYRYDGDMAIITLVDLATQRILKVETIPHLAVPLSEEEFAVARDLALADARVQQELGSHKGEVRPEALVLRTSDPEDPIYGHRVLRLMFRLGEDYLTRPIALVDLTAQRVTIEQPPTQKTHH